MSGLEEKIGQMLMVGFDGTTPTSDALYVVRDLRVGGLILFGSNYESPEQLSQLTAELQRVARGSSHMGLLIAVDQEGGRVQRLKLGFTALPAALRLGESDDLDRTRALSTVAATELAAVGVNMNLAPVLDVLGDAENPIGDRSYGSNAGAVARLSVAALQGLQNGGVIGVAKHFPGLGDAKLDTHFTAVTVNKDAASIRAGDLLPFRAAIAWGVKAIMVGHARYPAIDGDTPATMSESIVAGLLREELGFKGVVLTDDMGMAAIAADVSPEESAVAAVLAGADILICVRLRLEGACPPEMFPRLRAGLLDAVKDGRISESRIDESVARIRALKVQAGLD